MEQHINIFLPINNVGVQLSYNINGTLESVTNMSTGKKMATGKKMLFKFVQKDNNKIHDHSICDASYALIIELDYFIPKYLFIKNEKK